MGDRPQAEERMLFDLATIRRNYLKEALEDNEIDAEERSALRVIDNLIDFTSETRARRQFAMLIEKGGEVTDYMNRLAEPFGMKVINLDAEREARAKVVPIRGRDTGFAG